MYAILIYVLVGLVFEYFVTLAKNSQIIGYNITLHDILLFISTKFKDFLRKSKILSKYIEVFIVANFIKIILGNV